MSIAKYNLNHDPQKKVTPLETKKYPYTTKSFTSHSAFINHQRVTAIRMGVASFLALTLFTIIITLPALNAYESTNDFVLDQILFHLD